MGANIAAVTVLPPDYDADPDRWGSWQSPQDVHHVVAPNLHGPVLDIACGEGRLASLLHDGVRWFGVDSSSTQLAATSYRPVVLADMRALPFRDSAFAEVTHLWCLYHVDDPSLAIAEARRASPTPRKFLGRVADRLSAMQREEVKQHLVALVTVAVAV